MSVSQAVTIGSELEHRGQQGTGIYLYNQDSPLYFTASGRSSEVYTPDTLATLESKFTYALLHFRYGTSGGYGNGNIQPICRGDWVGIHNGNFAFSRELENYLRTLAPEDASDTVKFMSFLESLPGDTPEEKILKAIDAVDGFFNLCIGYKDKLFIMRDQNKGMPLSIGETDDQIIVASETCALDRAQVKTMREILPGEVLLLDKNGQTNIRAGSQKLGNFCGMQMAYFMRTDSKYNPGLDPEDYRHPENWDTIAEFRKRCGSEAAKEIHIPQPDFVTGIPWSGVHGGMGFAEHKGWEYVQSIVRRPEAKRLFQTDDDPNSYRDRVLNKYIFPDENIFRGANVVFVDDSIVRGNTSLWLNRFIRELGAERITLISLFPEIRHTCNYGVSMRTQDELVAFKSNHRQIAEKVGADEIFFSSHAGFVRAFRPGFSLDESEAEKLFLNNGLCPGCTLGISPLGNHSRYSHN